MPRNEMPRVMELHSWRPQRGLNPFFQRRTRSSDGRIFCIESAEPQNDPGRWRLATLVLQKSTTETILFATGISDQTSEPPLMDFDLAETMKCSSMFNFESRRPKLSSPNFSQRKGFSIDQINAKARPGCTRSSQPCYSRSQHILNAFMFVCVLVPMETSHIDPRINTHNSFV